jgi:DNA mismatch repair protein MutH
VLAFEVANATATSGHPRDADSSDAKTFLSRAVVLQHSAQEISGLTLGSIAAHLAIDILVDIRRWHPELTI